LRSEERFGIIYVALLLLWGTLITEPLRIYTDYFHDFVSKSVDLVGIDPTGRVGTAVTVAGMALLVVMLIIPARTELYRFIPAALFCVSLAVFLFRCLDKSYVDRRTAAALIIAVIVIGLMHLSKSENLLLWACDCSIYSLSAYLTCGLIFKPLSELGGVAGKILYAARYVPQDLAAPFDGMLSLPGYVWGIFIGILILIPQIYCVFLGRKG